MKARSKWFLIILMTLGLANGALAQPSRLKIYGFFDLEAEVSNRDRVSRYWTFDQHHLNLIFNYRLQEKTRLFTELEWEHGASHSASEMYGVIYLARAFVEYKFSDLLLIRAGKFLPPFGIYNERHDATPTFIFTLLPFSVYGNHINSAGQQGRLFSKFATGVWALGTLFADTWSLNYNLYISNGRGPNPAERDNNPNKAIGMRFVISPAMDNLQLGLSFYSDRDGNSFDTRQTSFGLDADWIWNDFELQSELLLARGEKVDAQNRPNGQFQISRGFYIQACYILGERWTPFLRYDHFDRDTNRRDDEEQHYVVGLNIALNYSVYTKAEVHFIDYINPTQKDYQLFIASVAVAF